MSQLLAEFGLSLPFGGPGGGGGVTEARSTPSGVKLLLVLLLGRGVIATAREFVGVKAGLNGSGTGGELSRSGSVGSTQSIGGYIDCNYIIERQLDTSPMPLMLKVIVLTLMYYEGLWDLRHALQEYSSQAAVGGEGSGGAAGAGEGSGGAAAGGEGVAAGAAAAAAGQGSWAAAAAGEAAVAGAARGGAVAGTEVLLLRLLQLPLQGLPEAVVQQLDRVKSKWPREVLREMQLPAAAAQQKELLQDLLLVVEVLLEEVPFPVGCSNTACVSMKGISENTAAGKACAGCKVVRYCSRECQVVHWKSHKRLCKRLQEEQGKEGVQ